MAVCCRSKTRCFSCIRWLLYVLLRLTDDSTMCTSLISVRKHDCLVDCFDFSLKLWCSSFLPLLSSRPIQPSRSLGNPYAVLLPFLFHIKFKRWQRPITFISLTLIGSQSPSNVSFTNFEKRNICIQIGFLCLQPESNQPKPTVCVMTKADFFYFFI